MASLPIWAAAATLGLYLMVLGLVHLRRRPMVVGGAVDSACLAAGLSGLAAVGPLAVLEPAFGASRWSWAVMAAVAVLGLAVAILASRPRVVVYNATVEQLRPAVAEVVLAIDPSARWAGDSVAMPSRGLQVHIVSGEPMRNVAVVAVGRRPSLEGWGEFSRRLAASVEMLRVSPSPWSWLFLSLGTALLVGAAWSAFAGL